ncbi:hypothetical protein JAAARDRAFT_31092 [Jaapia argillacea MUCL 33604]|uniref:Uncharacterized protein n=1 Tax=Jaapia argillacea MUCL 33604 TaxID=933084 RepID=A0A067QG72_9AGAM|nr:hypothetical protein JAAARDRAFT_31092 [Jaapia argillacea MUCL 33604]
MIEKGYGLLLRVSYRTAFSGLVVIRQRSSGIDGVCMGSIGLSLFRGQFFLTERRRIGSISQGGYLGDIPQDDVILQTRVCCRSDLISILELIFRRPSCNQNCDRDLSLAMTRGRLLQGVHGPRERRGRNQGESSRQLVDAPSNPFSGSHADCNKL